MGGGFGTSATLVTTRAPRSIVSASPARFGKLATVRIRDRLIEMATTTSPVSAAIAPSSATKKFCQSGDSEIILGSQCPARRDDREQNSTARPTRDRANRRRAG